MTSISFADMVVEQEGAGAPIVLLHGLGATTNSWQTLVPSLSGKRIIRPDLPGAGRSPTPSGPLTVDSIARSVIAMLAHLGVEQADFVGHSFGSFVALHIAGLRPSLVTRLAMFGPIAAPSEAIRERLKARATLARDQGMGAVADQLVPVALASGSASSNPLAAAFVRESHMRQDKEGFAKNCEALADGEAFDLSRLDCPLCVVTGDQDGVGPPSVAQDIADRVKRSRAHVVSDCGHWTPIEKPAACARLLAGFLNGQ